MAHKTVGRTAVSISAFDFWSTQGFWLCYCVGYLRASTGKGGGKVNGPRKAVRYKKGFDDIDERGRKQVRPIGASMKHATAGAGMGEDVVLDHL